jgi:hypothetical protein
MIPPISNGRLATDFIRNRPEGISYLGETDTIGQILS